MTSHPHRLTFYEGRAFACSRASGRQGDGCADGEYIVTIHADARHPIGLGTISDMLDGHLTREWSGVGVLIVVADEDDGQFQHGSEVHGLVEIAAA